MIKLIGAILIICTSAVLGYTLSKNLKKRCRALEEFIGALEYIKPCICVMDRRMEDILKDANEKFNLSGIFLNTLENFRLKGIKSAWADSVDSVAEGLCLNEDDRDIIKSVGERLGKTYAEDQRENIDGVILRLQMNLDLARMDYNKNGVLLRKCSVLTGIMLVMMLI